MVERHRHGDPIPKDPWIIRMMIKHPWRVYFALLALTSALGALVVGTGLYATHRLQTRYVDCMKTQSAKVLAGMLAIEGFNSDMVKEWSKNEAASTCCRRMGRIPVESGQLAVLCLPADITPLMYKSSYIPIEDEP